MFVTSAGYVGLGYKLKMLVKENDDENASKWNLKLLLSLHNMNNFEALYLIVEYQARCCPLNARHQLILM